MTEPHPIGPSLDGIHPIFFPESVPSALPPECYPASEIDAAIEQVVKTGSDTEALTEAVRALAGVLGYGLVNAATPVHGARGTCTHCGIGIQYFVHEDQYGNVLDAWWAHDVHPTDGHDAELGGPA